MTTLMLKYRPKTFKEVIGQVPIVRSLKQLLAGGTNRTILFSGPSGTGKTTLARIAAAEVGCLDQDITEIDGATFTGIDDMRQITSSLAYRPLGEGAVKAIIIDECHMLSTAAWQSLLKSLEEPPAWVYWFLCTTNADKVPATIKTRCTSYGLKSVSTNDLTDWLAFIADAEGIGDELKDCESIVALCARNASGSPRQALANLGLCMAAKSKNEAADLLKTAGDSSEAIDLARALIAGKPWMVIQEILETMKEQNPESIRHVVRAYMTKAILGSANPDERAFAILEAFSKPFPSGDGVSPLLLAIGGLIFA